MNLTENITLEECIKSATANTLGINNQPNKEEIINNLKELAINCLQPIRSHFNKPLIITSGYRCKKLNKVVGGANTSQHTKGQAVDFIIKGIKLEEIINYIRNYLDFDQLIEEHSGKSEWVHISYKNKDDNRKEVLRYRYGKYIRI